MSQRMVGLGQDILRSPPFHLPIKCPKTATKNMVRTPSQGKLTFVVVDFFKSMMFGSERINRVQLSFVFVSGRKDSATNKFTVGNLCNKFTNLQIYNFTNLQICKFTNLQIYKFTNF